MSEVGMPEAPHDETVRPVAEPITEPAVQPVTEPAAQPVVEPPAPPATTIWPAGSTPPAPPTPSTATPSTPPTQSLPKQPFAEQPYDPYDPGRVDEEPVEEPATAPGAAQQEEAEEVAAEAEAEARAGWLHGRLEELRRLSRIPGVHLSEEIDRVQGRLKKLRHEKRRHDTWVTVSIARHKDRPRTRDYIGRLIDGFEELKGDRLRADDAAIVGGMGWFEGRAVVVVGHQKGRDLNEQTEVNFGMARPEGYRKAQRLFALAERLRLPVLTFVDTPGAYPGIAAEEGGQARAIAETMLAMARLTVPVVATVIGEGGSGGALALAVADRVLMQENAVYSVISPEGCAAILWRDREFAPQAAEALRPTASQLLELGVIERVVPEARMGANHNPDWSAVQVREAIREALKELDALAPAERKALRRERFRKLGVFSDGAGPYAFSTTPLGPAMATIPTDRS
jgi:acetyl-CoA carboxylase carboxyl transferase alpha subunit